MNHRTVHSPSGPDELRAHLVDLLREHGVLRSAPVEEALRAVPRHAYLPNATVEEAYANSPVHIKYDHAGASLSCGSQPGVVAMMLEQAGVEPGMRVLEIGAGTGYNAALLGRLVGPRGSVTTMDVDADLVHAARARLAEQGADNVAVVLGDGALGHPEGAPYDRVVATVGSHDVPRVWVDQLAPGGRLVAPVRIAGDVSRSIAFQAGHDRWVSVESALCTFVPLRDGAGDDTRTVLPVDEDATVRLQVSQDQNIRPDQVRGVLAEPSGTVWSGVTVGGAEPWDALWLWWSTHLPNRLSRMPVERRALDDGLVRTGFPWGDMAAVPLDGRGLAHVTTRPVPGQRGANEAGIAAYGPDAGALAAEMADLARAWEPHRREDLAFELHHTRASVPEQSRTRRVLNRGRSALVVSWIAPG